MTDNTTPAPVKGVPAVYAAISGCTKELLGGISKDRQTTGYASFKFRGIDEIMSAVAPVLARNNLVILQRVVGEKVREERETAKGGAMFFTHIKMEFDFVSTTDGSMHTVSTFGEAQDSGDKSTNKAMSAAYKYALMQGLCIPVENVADSDTVQHEPTRPSGALRDMSDLIAKRDSFKASVADAKSVGELAGVKDGEFYRWCVGNGEDVPKGWSQGISKVVRDREVELSM